MGGSEGTFLMVAVGNYRNRAEVRKNPRQNFHYNTRIFIDKDQPPIACSISDISHSGARLTLKEEQELPEAFTLLLTPNGGARRHCRVVRCDGLIVGVQFPESD
jgi:PilZ domain